MPNHMRHEPPLPLRERRGAREKLKRRPVDSPPHPPTLRAGPSLSHKGRGTRFAAVSAALFLAFLAPARAEVVLTSKSPYWKVGPRDDALSKACALGRFNLGRPERLVAQFRGKDGPETLGIAKGSGLNLRDPDRRAKPNEDYFFRNHGTTGCEVYVGGRKGGPTRR
jgi:hypothetical protein